MSTSPVSVTVAELIALRRKCAALKRRPRQPKAAQSGDYTSAIKGRGMEFDESRLYQPGDDIRNMDWRVTARTGKAHSKLYREERERPVFVWVDYRAPMFFATQGVFKSVFATRMAALIAWHAVQQGDRIGGLVFSEQEHHELKPGQGKPAVLQLINRLVQHPAWQNFASDQDAVAQLGIQKALLRLNRLVRPGSLIYLLSDFRGLEQAQAEIARLSKQGEVILIPVHDVLEERLPEKGQYRFSHQDQELTVNASDRSTQQKYQQHYQRHTDYLEQLCARYGMRILPCLTTDDAAQKLNTHA